MRHHIFRTGKSILVAGLLLVFAAGRGWASHDGVGDADAGERVYNETCVACHGSDGRGAVAGVPDFASKDSGLNHQSDSILLHHILNGFQDSRSPFPMPPKGGNPDLTVKDIQDVLSYLHLKFHYRRR